MNLYCQYSDVFFSLYGNNIADLVILEAETTTKIEAFFGNPCCPSRKERSSASYLDPIDVFHGRMRVV